MFNQVRQLFVFVFEGIRLASITAMMLLQTAESPDVGFDLLIRVPMPPVLQLIVRSTPSSLVKVSNSTVTDTNEERVTRSHPFSDCIVFFNAVSCVCFSSQHVYFFRFNGSARISHF